MILILKRICSSTVVGDIEDFIAPVLKGGLFKRTGHLENVAIQLVKEAKTQKTEFYAFIRVEPDAVGKRIIKLLNRKALKGKLINIAEYHVRCRGNDRRISRYRKLNDRRCHDRRRLGLEISDITDQSQTAVPADLGAIEWKTDSTV